MELSELRKEPHLSTSSITSYTMCGLKYRFRYIDKLQSEFSSDNLLFGSAIHKTLQNYQEEKMIGNYLTSDDLSNLFQSYWKESAENNESIQYSKGKNYKNLMTMGKSLLTKYLEEIPDYNYTIIAVEEPFSFTIDELNIPIIGAVDLIEEDENGSIIVTDFKTASKAYAINDVDNNFQLTMYYMAMKANGYNDQDIQLKFDCLIKTRQVKFEQIYTTRSELMERRAIKKIKEVWNGIQKQVFIPNDTGWQCSNCEYSNQCQAWFEDNQKEVAHG